MSEKLGKALENNPKVVIKRIEQGYINALTNVLKLLMAEEDRRKKVGVKLG